jgi:hypothetical protein
MYKNFGYFGLFNPNDAIELPNTLQMLGSWAFPSK